MSTVKISQLPNIPGGLNANTSNSLFLGVDIPTGITGKFTATQLAERLYANNVLNVGDNPIVLPNVVAQFAGDSEEYLQINLFNSTANGSADFVVTADTGTDTTHYIDVGINNSNYDISPLDGYVIVAGDGTSDPGGNLILGSITSGKEIDFVIGGYEQANVVAKMIDGTGFRLTKKPIIFADATSQNTAASPANYTQGAFDAANTAAANTIAINTLALAAYGKANAEGTINNTQNTNIASVNTYSHMASFIANNSWNSANAGVDLANSAYNKANTAAVNIIYLQTVNDEQNSHIASVNVFSQSAFNSANAGIDLANSAYNKANNALANTTGIFDGSLTITGNVTVATGITLNDAGLYQYNTSNNTTVTQLTNKSTAVYSNGRTGQITTSSASLAKGDSVQFTVYNSQVVSAKDTIIVNIASGATAASYQICVDSVTTGSFGVCITNNGTGPLSEALVINYAILRVN